MKYARRAVLRSAAVQRLVQAAKAGRLPAYLSGLTETYKQVLSAALCDTLSKRGVFVVPDMGEAQRLCDLFTMFYAPDDILLFPAREYIFYNFESISRTQELERIAALDRMRAGRYKIALVPADALMQLLPPADFIEANTMALAVGGRCELAELTAFLVRAGYAHAEITESPGQFSHRGGIVEFFSPNYAYPVRLELFGDEVDSLAFYDAQTQRRIDATDSVSILPVLEVLPTEQTRELIDAHIKKHIRRLQRRGGEQEAVAACQSDLEHLQNMRFPAIDRYLPLVNPAPWNVLDYDPAALVFCFNLTKVKESFKGFSFKLEQDIAALLERGLPACKGAYFYEPAQLYSLLERRGLILMEDFLRQENDIVFQYVDGFHVKSLTTPGTDAALTEEIGHYHSHGYTCAIFAGSPARGDWLPRLFEESGIAATHARTEPDEIEPGGVCILSAGFPGGFEDPDAKFALFGSGRLTMARRKKGRYERGERITGFADIKPGDYIVHENYGIGIYEGVHKVESQGITKDFIKIRYAGTDTLFVPCGQFDQISKYIGASPDVKVKLNKLGTGEWARAKSRARANVKDLAKQLIALYAERQKIQGFAFSPDSEWQREFEAAFEYEETEDQRISTEEIKADMEKQAPMDRLLCGDVGFGKTEVALRAAFKCVLDGKQVAMLVPTTLLAWQHYNTIRRRFEGYPVRAELLSRFRTPAQQQVILRKLRRGEIDILVGTHRIIQKDVQFKDLGLLIVDEEQRFGVSHKENLKEMTKTVDVLTLTATPIPRTLNMALAGIRDMSVLEEPPQDRHPISTYVLEYDEGIVMDALRREIGRGGQCYYLYNRVESIYRTADRIQKALPESTVEVAHGQMSKEELATIWDRMLEGEIDVLVCTTIIETGVDVANANTLIIEDADRLGLAQLHQIRGRVGRSYKHAYAYFTYRKGKVLTEDGRRRLDAIREYTEFGSGFKLAMRDLQIRGAGNLLGAQQHGHMDSVGYDMYMQLLGRAIAEEKGEIVKRPSECTVDIKVNAYIPDTYIESALLRVDIYKKISAITDELDCSDIIDELCDRFGEPPKQVLDLIDVSLIRAQCSAAGVVELTQSDRLLQFYMADNNIERIAAVVSAFGGKMYYSAGAKPCLSYRHDGDPVRTAKAVAKKLLELTSETAGEKTEK